MPARLLRDGATSIYRKLGIASRHELWERRR